MDELSLEKPMFGKNVVLAAYDSEHIQGDIVLADAYQMVLADAYQEGLRLQHIFNIYDNTSELSLLNKNRNMSVSAELLEVVSYALKLAEETKGAYDITIGKNFMERKQGKPLSKIACSYKDILIQGNKIILKHPDIQLDLGSIAKGYIADKIAEYMKSNGLMNGMVDARGDIVFFGDYEHKIGIQHPRNDGTLGWLLLSDKAVATSGDYYQYQGSYDKSHIVNQKDVTSITIMADSLMVADAFATALFVIDEQDRISLLDKYPGVQALIVDKDLHIKTFNGFQLTGELLG